MVFTEGIHLLSLPNRTDAVPLHNIPHAHGAQVINIARIQAAVRPQVHPFPKQTALPEGRTNCTIVINMNKLISRHILHDMQLLYITDTDRDITGLCIIPSDMEVDLTREHRSVQPLAECKIIGDDYPGDYFGGLSMKYSQSTFKLHFYDQQVINTGEETIIKTFLKSDSKVGIVHTAVHKNGREYITVFTEFINNSDIPVALEMLSSLAVCGISPFSDGAAVQAARGVKTDDRAKKVAIPSDP